VIDAARTRRASGTSMMLSLLEMAWLRWGQAMTDRTNGESAFHVAGIASIDMISTAPNAEVVPLKINAPRQETKSLGSDRPGGPSRPADARQQPSHDSVVRLAATALKLVLLDGPFGEGRGLICRLSLVLRKRHPLANDFPTRLVVFHVCSTLGCNFSTRPEATASFTASRNCSGLVHAIPTASMWRAHRDFHRQNVLARAEIVRSARGTSDIYLFRYR
jgi:hypothetical protein